MAVLPSAKVSIDDQAGAQAGATDLIAVLAPVWKNADSVPRVFSSMPALIAKHDYAPGVDYCGLHLEETKKPVLFVPMPIVTVGTLGRFNATGNTGTSVVSVAQGVNGVLEEVDGVLTVDNGGTIGVNGIVLGLSLDGGRTKKQIRLGAANSYLIPYVGQQLNFGAGTLVTNDVAFRWSSTAPRADAAGIAAARAALAAQQKQVRSWIVAGDLQVAQDATDVLTQVNAYETSNDRFVYARAQVRDRKTQAAMSRTQVRMTGNPTVTFAEVGATGDTITRSAGSFVADGFAVNDFIVITGTVSNNVSGKITAVTATVLTLDTTDLTPEGPISNVTITGSNSLIFASGANTITRSGGSWLNDGFAVGDSITITGTVSNNVTRTITALTATVMTLGAAMVNETAGSFATSILAGEDDPTWVAAIDGLFGSIDSQRRIDLGAGRGRKRSTITDFGWLFRRPASWAASIREYQHDVQIPTYRKKDGALLDWSLEDAEGKTVEHDERTMGGLLLGRFTCFRTYANGPRGTFIALSLTRAAEGSLLSRTHNMAVANVASSICQAETENAIGEVLELKPDGTGTEASLVVLEERVNTQLKIGLLQNKSEGKRASDAKWKASRTDILNIPAAELTGTLDLRINSTLEKITTRVRVQTG